MRTTSFTLFAAALLLSACATAPRDTAPPSQIPPPIAERLQAIGPVVNPPETAKLYAPLAQREPGAGVTIERDVAYGAADRHRLDVFAPAGGGGARPVLVFVHGGAFVAGNKTAPGSPFYDNVMLWAAKSGYVGINMTYRLAPKHAWPDAQHDIASALAWVRANVAARGGDPARVFLMGHSAGAAHVAQYLAHPQFHGVPGSGLAGAIMVSGLFDPVTADFNPPLKAYFGTDKTRFAERSALPGMTRSKVPMLLVLAELDPPDFHKQFAQARSALCQAGTCPTSLTLRGHSHMSEIYAVNTGDTVLGDAMRAFIAGR